MKIAITGGTGFIGSYVIRALLDKGFDLMVTGTDEAKARQNPWFDKVSFIELDINKEPGEHKIKELASADKLIHLAWSGLPNYKALFHFENNLPSQYFFLKALVDAGLNDISITGTCFEYGMHEGALGADHIADPQNPYAIAKDSLRKFLQQLQKSSSFSLKWLRLFYMYGEGQSANSILSQLDIALNNEAPVFNMSGGEQLRDYLPVEEVARQIVERALWVGDGIFNICSGEPISIKQLVKDYLAKHNKEIKLNFGYYPYADYEPMAFWGIK